MAYQFCRRDLRVRNDHGDDLLAEIDRRPADDDGLAHSGV